MIATEPISGVSVRWVGEESADLVGRLRSGSFGEAPDGDAATTASVITQLATHQASWLVAEVEGEPVGTASSLPFRMWVRGGSLSCQGVADVGTLKTWRSRRDLTGDGIGSAMMRGLLTQARESGAVLSALTPFRSAYYGRFGYGIVERRATWTIPMEAIGRDAGMSFSFFQERDRAELMALRDQVTRAGQGDLERTASVWDRLLASNGSNFMVVERQARGGRLCGYAAMARDTTSGKETLRIVDHAVEDMGGLGRLIQFAGSMRDEFAEVKITTQADSRLPLLLAEPQIMHHTGSQVRPMLEVRPYTRLMVRVLDHQALLAGLRPLDNGRSITATVRIREPEGHEVTLSLELSGGRVHCTPALTEPDLTLDASSWAQVVMGDHTAAVALAAGHAQPGAAPDRAVALLDQLGIGPSPFCHESF